MNQTDPIQTAWTKEYERKGIPSSFRKDPTKTVVEFMTWLKENHHQIGGIAADIGCGRGRNSFYLTSQDYKVIAIELLQENIDFVNAHACSNHLPIQAYAQDASSHWPISPHSLDIAIDVFCYKHIVNKSNQASYRQELWKALKPNGLYFVSLASEQDGFYGPLLKSSPNLKEKLIIDPHSNIPSFLYSIHDLHHEFSDLFELVKISEQTSTSPMYGQEYSRVVLNAIFRKRIEGLYSRSS